MDKLPPSMETLSKLKACNNIMLPQTTFSHSVDVLTTRSALIKNSFLIQGSLGLKNVFIKNCIQYIPSNASAA